MAHERGEGKRENIQKLSKVFNLLGNKKGEKAIVIIYGFTYVNYAWGQVVCGTPLPNYICLSHQIQQNRYAMGPICWELQSGTQDMGLL